MTVPSSHCEPSAATYGQSACFVLAVHRRRLPVLSRTVQWPLAMPGAPQRRATDNHVHPDSWTRAEQHRHEDHMASELKEVSEEISGVREEVRSLNNRMTMLLGGLAILAFLLPIAAPFLRSMLGIPIQP